jgi:hypothetical protein
METTLQTATRRWPLFLLGLLLFILGPISVFAQLHFHDRHTPYQAPILATLGVLLMAVSLWQRGGIIRGIALFLFAALCGLEWFLLLVAMKTPDYAGPTVGQKTPPFTTTLANGSAFTNDDLAKGENTVLIFFRGHW